MANPLLPIPREVQSDLHDMADEIGEQIARGTLVDLSAERQTSLGNYEVLICTCMRMAQRVGTTHVKYWYEADPDCKYIHLANPPEIFTVLV